MQGETPSPVILEQDVDIRSVIEMARRATEEIIKAIGQEALDAARNRAPSNVEKGKIKVDASKLMLACRRSTGSLLEDISSITPHIPVMSEELKTVPLVTRQHYQYMWYIEPMDGLQAALSTGSVGHLSVCIALCHGTTPIIGVVHCLIESVTYFAIKGQGAYGLHAKDLYDISSKNIRRLKASTMPSSGGAIVVVPAEGNALTHRLFKQLEKQCSVKTILPRSHAIGMLHVAQGSAHVFLQLGELPEWTTAAPHIIVTESGGEVFTYPLPGPLQYNKETLIHPPYVASARPSTQELFNKSEQFPAIFTSMDCEITISRIIESACIAREKILQGVPWQMRQNYKVHWVVDIISKDHRRSDVNDNEKLVSADDKTGESLAAVNGSEAAQTRTMVSISLCREKRPISAVILDISQGTVFFSEKGQGSYRADLKKECSSLLQELSTSIAEISLSRGKKRKGFTLVDESTKVPIATREIQSDDVMTFLRNDDSPSINVEDYMSILEHDDSKSAVKHHGGCGIFEWLDYVCYRFLKSENGSEELVSDESIPFASTVIIGHDVTEWEVSAMDLIISEAGGDFLICKHQRPSAANETEEPLEDDQEGLKAAGRQTRSLSEPLYNSRKLSFSACVMCHGDAKTNAHIERRHPNWTGQVEKWAAKSPRSSSSPQTSPKSAQGLLNWIWPSSA